MVLRPLVSKRFQVLFHSLIQGTFHPFPHGTSSLSVLQYLALSDGSDRFRRDFTCPALLRIPLEIIRTYVYGTITLYGSTFQLILLRGTSHVVVLQPQSCRNKNWFGLFQFLRRYYRNHYCSLPHKYLDVSVLQVSSFR